MTELILPNPMRSPRERLEAVVTRLQLILFEEGGEVVADKDLGSEELGEVANAMLEEGFGPR